MKKLIAMFIAGAFATSMIAQEVKKDAPAKKDGAKKEAPAKKDGKKKDAPAKKADAPKKG
ncbi:MAG: hypothetical protein ACHQRM_15405 [Bacteroidia bacterium]